MFLEDFKNRVLPTKNKLYRFAFRIVGDTDEAEDIVQEVFLKVWNNRSEMHLYRNMEAWCMRLTKNLSLDKVKSKSFKTSREKQEVDLPLNGYSPHQQTEWNDVLQKIDVFINELPEKQKHIIQLRDVEGYSYKEIADILELDLNQIKVNLFRARKTIKDKLQKTESYGL
ncbi:RNA polymerase sigma factor [Flexithrix dorotheae]|uniref:RNA polymerase sigma factor n=1 Tax=Flexithrix dorotheae TaxID=70993 RepID=UPI00035FD8A7|nr:RNA polymerase sigma factor [Flexithrix dorotheae]